MKLHLPPLNWPLTVQSPCCCLCVSVRTITKYDSTCTIYRDGKFHFRYVVKYNNWDGYTLSKHILSKMHRSIPIMSPSCLYSSCHKLKDLLVCTVQPSAHADSNNTDVSGKLLNILIEAVAPPPTSTSSDLCALPLRSLSTIAMHAKIRYTTVSCHSIPPYTGPLSFLYTLLLLLFPD